MFSYPCGIPDTRDEYFYVTGDLDQVTKFGPNGFLEFLPNLKTGRKDHACAGYYDAQDHFVLLVVGGRTNSRGESAVIFLMSVILVIISYPRLAVLH